MKKNIFSNLRALGIVLFLCRRWFKVLYWPSLILIILASIGLLFYWNENSRSNNIWNFIILVAALLVAAGF